MSLIQEALKRQQEEGGDSNDDQGASPPTPQPASEPGHGADSGKTAKEILPGISATPPTMAAPGKPPIGGVKKDEDSPPPPPPPEQEGETEENITPPPTQSPILESSRPAKKRSPLLIGILVVLIVFIGLKVLRKPNDESADDLHSEDAVEAATAEEMVTEPAETEIITTPAEEPETATTVTAEPIETQTARPKTQEPAVVEWPPLTLTAVMGKGSKGSAMINGQLLGVGEQMQGVTFVRVGKGGIYLKYKGETRFVKRGQTTY